MFHLNKKTMPKYLMRVCASYALGSFFAHADPIWHCSRTSVHVADAMDNFSLASLDSRREVVRISLRDLYAAYQGNSVKASGHKLSACLIGGNSPETKSAMNSIDADIQVLEKMSQSSALIASNVYVVKNEHEMLNCMTKNYPAIGYFSQAMHTETVGPCF